MAQLKDSIVSGNLRITDTLLSDAVQVTTLRAPSTAGGTSYGVGTNGQVIRSNGTSSYWGSITNSDLTTINNTAAGPLGWTSASQGTALPTLNTIAYWNGAYGTGTSTNSNLEYCKIGKFGSIVTKTTSDYVANTNAGVCAAINLLTAGSSDPQLADYYVSQYAGGGTSTTTYHRRPLSNLWNTFRGLITVTTTGSGNAVTSVSIANGTGNDASKRIITVTKGSTFSTTDTKVNTTLATTTKAYLLGTSTTPTSSAQAVESLADTGVYLTTTAGTIHATTFEGSLNGTVTVTETHGKSDGTEPTAQQTYYVPFMVDKTSTNYIRSNDGIRYATYDGDTTANPKTAGIASLRVGNNKTVDDEGNMRGSILLFGSGEDYVHVLPTTLTAYRTIYFPDESGTLAIKSQDDTNEMLNLLGVGDLVPVDNDYYISQYVNGGTTTTTYHRRSVLNLWQYMKSKMTNGSNVSFSTDDTTKVLTIAADNNKVTSTAVAASTAETTYYPTFSSSSTTNTAGINKIASFRAIHTPGTTSVVGNTRIVLGNSTASGTANNEEGIVRLYSSGTSYHTIKGAVINSSGGATHTLPATSGTVQNDTLIYGLAPAIDPAEGSTYDLDNLPIGRYRVSVAAAAARCLHTPITTVGFEIICRNTSVAENKVQILMPALSANSTLKWYMRFYKGTGSSPTKGWTPWNSFTGTAVS